jgi:hypothetical protein
MEQMTTYQARSAWLMQWLGPPAEMMADVMEDGSTEVGILFFPPFAGSTDVRRRSHHVLVSNGISERRMPCINEPHGPREFRAEVMAYTRDASPELATLLLNLGRLPFESGTGLLAGQTLANTGQGLWSGFLLWEPLLEDDEFNPVGFDLGFAEDFVFHVLVIGLKADEWEEVRRIGGVAFAQRYLHKDMDVENLLLDQDRPSLLSSGAGPR